MEVIYQGIWESMSLNLCNLRFPIQSEIKSLSVSIKIVIFGFQNLMNGKRVFIKIQDSVKTVLQTCKDVGQIDLKLLGGQK